MTFDEHTMLTGMDDRTGRIITLMYYAYEGYRTCRENLADAVRNNDDDSIRSILTLQEQYRQAALKARRMLEQ